MSSNKVGFLKKSLNPSKKIVLSGINQFLKSKYPASAALADADNNQLGKFLEYVRSKKKPRVLELGVKRANPNVSTMHHHWIPDAGKYVGTDYQDGLDVDQKSDVHELSRVFGSESFDVILSCSSFEHFKYPFLAAHEIMKTLKIGGALFIQTHQTFPLHAYPNDYFRYSTDGLKSLFGTKNGFKVCGTSYEFPAQIVNSELADLIVQPAYLNSCLYGIKEAETPKEFQYEIECGG